MSFGLPLPVPFPQYVGSPPTYKPVATYPVLYGQTVHISVNGTNSVVGSVVIGDSYDMRAPGFSNKMPADPYQILDAKGNIPRDPYKRPLPVKYGDQITLRNLTTNDFWQISKRVLLGSGKFYKPAVLLLQSPIMTPKGNALSAHVAGSVPFGTPQPNEAVLISSEGSIGLSQSHGLGLAISPGTGARFSFMLAQPTPYPSEPSRVAITSISNTPYVTGPDFYFPTMGYISPIYPSHLSLNQPPSPVYQGPLPPN